MHVLYTVYSAGLRQWKLHDQSNICMSESLFEDCIGFIGKCWKVKIFNELLANISIKFVEAFTHQIFVLHSSLSDLVK